MGEPFADVEDLRLRRSLTAPEEPTAEELLAEASARLRQRVPSIDERLASGALDPVIPRGVVCRMVIDVLNNPDRFTTEQIEDAVYRFDTQLVRQQMVPTESELADLRPPAGVSGQRARTIATPPVHW